jgi:hypothetical protein
MDFTDLPAGWQDRLSRRSDLPGDDVVRRGHGRDVKSNDCRKESGNPWYEAFHDATPCQGGATAGESRPAP